jgi:hypothetical protein
MSTDPVVTRIVRSWLEEGATVLPDRVLDAVLDQLPATPQRRAWWPVRRFEQMNNYAKVAIAAVAVIAVAAIGITLIPRSGGVGASPAALTPTASQIPTASPTPTPTSSPAPTDESPAASELGVVRTWPGSRPDENPAGRYSWDPDADGTAWQGPRAFKGDTSGWMHRVPDAIAVTFSKSDNAYGPGPESVKVAGYDATYQELPLNKTDPDSWPEGFLLHVWIVDIDDTKITITVQSAPSTSAEVLAEAKAIVDSIILERTTKATGFKLTFDLQAGWDSG